MPDGSSSCSRAAVVLGHHGGVGRSQQREHRVEVEHGDARGELLVRDDLCVVHVDALLLSVAGELVVHHSRDGVRYWVLAADVLDVAVAGSLERGLVGLDVLRELGDGAAVGLGAALGAQRALGLRAHGHLPRRPG